MVTIDEKTIMRKWNKHNNPLVSICCVTFNHAKFIEETLDGFLKQDTTFSFEIIIHDDCSTDGTTDIIRQYKNKYPNIITTITQDKNQYSQGKTSIIALFMLDYFKGKYIAFCEGDDYWTDNSKLQKQVDFLNNNDDYGMCYTGCQEFYQDTGLFKKSASKQVNLMELYSHNFIGTLTTVVRKDLYLKYLEEINPQDKDWLMGDYPLWLYLAHESKIKYLDFNSAVYRILSNSASHFTDFEKKVKFRQSCVHIQSFFADKYNIEINSPPDDVIEFNEACNYLKLGYNHKSIAFLTNAYKKLTHRTFKIILKYFFYKWKLFKF